MQRILALDVGDKRIGIAVSDPLGFTAQPVETYHRVGSQKKDVAYIIALTQRYAPCKLLFGLPRNMDGSYGEQAEKVRHFAELVLSEFEGEHDYYDERLTTMAARRILLDADISRNKQKKVIDKLAATVILQSYMDSHR